MWFKLKINKKSIKTQFQKNIRETQRPALSKLFKFTERPLNRENVETRPLSQKKRQKLCHEIF